ncbi:pollen-specific leucine-rich repeat extensin-like protein 3 [Homalodisca vitripennis]|uniref:pollen-specific leucine-rich repeat extensin-like protein 3 n=1 Tax=Homalodisca vitripennis TaxID=197043 RepID=UPI001EEB1289|nr:pollen-specific leucine-rich repeat extensin-like protein 3 [Homalodisca vitripennis]
MDMRDFPVRWGSGEKPSVDRSHLLRARLLHQPGPLPTILTAQSPHTTNTARGPPTTSPNHPPVQRKPTSPHPHHTPNQTSPLPPPKTIRSPPINSPVPNATPATQSINHNLAVHSDPPPLNTSHQTHPVPTTSLVPTLLHRPIPPQHIPVPHNPTHDQTNHPVHISTLHTGPPSPPTPAVPQPIPNSTNPTPILPSPNLNVPSHTVVHPPNQTN